ncbi:hypothetical protein DCAR_0415450 [Daucus carota subsp. sativus]|uniref:Uncharacterized protein n=1 Tax=Daucus carota subsp. sativus TaxID=79200 RepID=A0AAF1AV61_DAUCS|nr:hypothetical protein DCAR_0415450 [Daucus carota subsp. sativus]
MENHPWTILILCDRSSNKRFRKPRPLTFFFFFYHNDKNTQYKKFRLFGEVFFPCCILFGECTNNFCIINCLLCVYRFDYRIFMNSRTITGSIVSCQSGNKNFFFCRILVCLLTKFFKTPTANLDFHLIKAVDRSLPPICSLTSF